MAKASWLVDGNRIATKIKSASGATDPVKINWKSNPSRACPSCHYTIDNSDVTQEWPGLPRGVKFDPTDQEIIWHLQAKVGLANLKPHPFIDEFIPTVDEDDGICYTHPRNLPGVKQDGSASHFFYRSIKAYNTGTRKRRKIHGDDLGDVRWHKTGRTKPVMIDGVQRGCKKILVLYMNKVGSRKPEKTNWVMHQYHLGTEEDEKDEEFVISKVFYQQQQVKQNDKNVEDIPDLVDDVLMKVDPVTPKSVTPDPPNSERRASDDAGKGLIVSVMDFVAQEHYLGYPGGYKQAEQEQPVYEVQIGADNLMDQALNNDGDQAGEEPKWWDSESQHLLDSQQLVEGLSLCDDLLRSQSPNQDGMENDGLTRQEPSLADYALLGPEHLKKDLEECQTLVLNPANIELDTPPDFRLSQLEFGSQESFLAWGIGKGD